MLLADERVGGAMASQASLGWSSDAQHASHERLRGVVAVSARACPLSPYSSSTPPLCVLSVLLCLLMGYYNTYM